MNQGKIIEFQETGIVNILKMQDFSPFYASNGVDELLRAYPFKATKQMAQNMFMLGYIEGKRAERARRRK